MGSRVEESPGNLYVIYLTTLQAEVIARFCRQSQWDVTTFMCVPDKVRTLVERAMKDENQIHSLKDTGVNTERLGCNTVCDVTSDYRVWVDGTQYQEIGLFDEVLNIKKNDVFDITDPVCCRVLDYLNKGGNSSSSSARHKRKGNTIRNNKKDILDVVTGQRLLSNECQLKTEKEKDCDRNVSRWNRNEINADCNSYSKSKNTGKSVKEIMADDNDSDSLGGMATTFNSDCETDVEEVNDKNIGVCDTNSVCDANSSVSMDTETVMEETKCSTLDIRNNITNEHQTKDPLNAIKKECIKPEYGNSPAGPFECKVNTTKTPNSSKTPGVGLGKKSAGFIKSLLERREKKSGGYIKSLLERRETLACELCGKISASAEFYRRHMRLVHSEEAVKRRRDKEKMKGNSKEIHVCQLCKKQFVDRSGLRQHETNMHSGPRPLHQCHQCGAILKFKGSLATHMQIVHSDMRPHQCDICHKKFKAFQHLKSHQRRHDPGYIDTCTVCGKTVSKGHLSSHLKRHSEDKKYQCDSCDKTFFEKQDLSRHKRVHSGERPYQCPHCLYTCAIKGNMTKHVKHKHEQESLYPSVLHTNHTKLNINKKNGRKTYLVQTHSISKEGNGKRFGYDGDNATDNKYDSSRSLTTVTKEGNSITTNEAGQSPLYMQPDEDKYPVPSRRAPHEAGQSPLYMQPDEDKYPVPSRRAPHEAGNVKHSPSRLMDMDQWSTTRMLQGEQGLLALRAVGHAGCDGDKPYTVGGSHSAPPGPRGQEPFMSYLVSHDNDGRNQYGGQF